MKDLTAFLAPNLPLKLGDKTYSVPPPCYKTGLQLTAIITVGRASASGAKVSDQTQAIYDSVDPNRDLGELSLTPAILEQMREDGLVGADISMASEYALYYWVLGEATADAIIAQKSGADEAPKAPKTGPSTESENPTPTASTPATATPRATSDRSPRKPAASRGSKSSTGGARSSATSPSTTR